jgi:hypothetical protein
MLVAGTIGSFADTCVADRNASKSESARYETEENSIKEAEAQANLTRMTNSSERRTEAFAAERNCCVVEAPTDILVLLAGVLHTEPDHVLPRAEAIVIDAAVDVALLRYRNNRKMRFA